MAAVLESAQSLPRQWRQTAWTRPTSSPPTQRVNESVISLRPFDLAAEPTGDAEDVATTIFDRLFLTGGRGGALVAWRPTPSSTIVEGFVVGKAGGESGP